MAVIYEKEQRLITIETRNTTYQMKVDPYGYLLHLYYGKKVSGSAEYLLQYYDRGFSGNPSDAGADRCYSLDVLPLEYPFQGSGDYRSQCFRMKDGSGAYGCDLRFDSIKVWDGKYSLEGLPAAYGDVSETQTLEILLKDEASGLSVTLYYGVFEELDVITRAVEVKNEGSQTVILEKVQSACLDLLWGDYELLTFYGRHAMERNLERARIGHGAIDIGSRRGTSSHQYNPFIIAAEVGASETYGNCWGMNFVYSGGFRAEAGRDPFGLTRISMGLQDEMFSWNLEPGACFTAPEVLLSFSDGGFEKLSHQFHRMIRSHICRGPWRDKRRPVLINNWEATYFDFDGDKIVRIAEQAADLGVEMLVLDDGWFGNRDSDNRALGDWYVNEKKLCGTLKELTDRISALGMKFGIWMEPEMISEDSDLYREHPDWAFRIPGRKFIRSRNQLVLDFSRKEVVDCIFEQICRVLDSADISYVKWDMNRSISDVYSPEMGTGRQGEVLHRYVLGLYDLLERLLTRYPHLLIEGCSGGGGRFDAGMLYYTPQIWCSDNTDAIDRCRIQYGTSFAYPTITVGAHVSAVPNHQTGRIVPMETRGVVAMAGSFGYELDLNRLTEEEKKTVRRQTEEFKNDWELIHKGDYYRLTDPFDADGLAAWASVAEDRSEALLSVITLNSHGNQPVHYVKLRGLDEEGIYEDVKTGKRYRGAALMYGGMPVPYMEGEYRGWQAEFKKVE